MVGIGEMTKYRVKTFGGIRLSAASTLSRLSAEIAYTKKRMAVRRHPKRCKIILPEAERMIEKAVVQAMKDEGMKAQWGRIPQAQTAIFDLMPRNGVELWRNNVGAFQDPSGG